MATKSVSIVGALALVIPLTVLGCGGGSDSSEVPDQGEVDPTGQHNQFVFNELRLPTTTNEAAQLGLDLDNDNLGRPDNVSLSLSGQLQVPSLGGRMVAGRLCHFADCRLIVAEELHGAQTG